MHQKFLNRMKDHSKDRVNPFLTFMYYRLSFLSWLSLMRKYERLKNEAKAKDIRKEWNEAHGIINNDYDKTSFLSTQSNYEEVDVEVAYFSEYSMSSEEEREF